MPNIKLKNYNGLDVTYQDVDVVTIPLADSTTSSSPNATYYAGVEGGKAVFFKAEGSNYAVSSVASDASVDAPTSDPTRESSIFEGWSTTSGDATNIVTFPYTSDGDTVLYAVYKVVDSNLNNDDWGTISTESQAGLASNYWHVGEEKLITVNGTIGTLTISNQAFHVFILGFDHNSDVEGKGISFGCFGYNTADTDESGEVSHDAAKNIVLVDSGLDSYHTDGTKYFNMNHWGNYNYGGWAACDMRYDILGSTDVQPSTYGSARSSGDVGYDATTTCATSPVSGTLMAALPEDLRAVMTPITKYTDNIGGAASNVESKVTTTVDYLPLLAEYEVFGSRSYANSYEQNHQKQYTYFANGASTISYKYLSNSTAAWWWERSPVYGGSGSFCMVGGSGGAYGSNVNYSGGVFAAFKV